MTDDYTPESRPSELPAVKTTIVGGRPPGSGRTVGPIPRGIEVLIKKAAVDPTFKATLLARRADAAADIGLTLTPAETLMLRAAPADQLDAVIQRTRVDAKTRPAFLGKAAAVMLAALGASSVVGCDRDVPTKGIRPQAPPPQTVTAPADPAAARAGEFAEPAPGDRLAASVSERVAGPPTTQGDARAATKPSSAEYFGDLLAGGASRGVRPDIPPTQGIRPDIPALAEGARPDRPMVTDGARPDRPPATQPASPASQPDAGPVTDEQFKKLLTDLDSPQFAVREAAQTRLEHAGSSVLPKLKQALSADTLPPEAAVRVRELLARAEKIDSLIKKLDPPPPMPMAGVMVRREPPEEQAERELTELGPAALPLLKDVLASRRLVSGEATICA